MYFTTILKIERKVCGGEDGELSVVYVLVARNKTMELPIWALDIRGKSMCKKLKVKI